MKLKRGTGTMKCYLTFYRDSGKSIRKLSEETRISTSSIFQTLKYCKNQIRINVGEDFEDFINEDYEHL